MDYNRFVGRICRENSCSNCNREREYHSWTLAARPQTTTLLSLMNDRPSTGQVCSKCYGTGKRPSIYDYRDLIPCSMCRGRGSLKPIETAEDRATVYFNYAEVTTNGNVTQALFIRGFSSE
eukprot:TRINITY_DN291_c0_g1_i6.p1 TRINITY_DN291_c0_g1~~TRINITY_DN291_c0_g1_i6.p1  ORF type:complete len:121 (-),score=12.55 TRINITY_DN291_c0_g1_i6:127-489(-)